MSNIDLDNLRHRLQKAQHRNNIKKNTRYYDRTNAFTIAIELTSGIITGVIIGTWLDKRFNSTPAFLLVCLCIGTVAGVKIIWRYINHDNKH